MQPTFADASRWPRPPRIEVIQFFVASLYHPALELELLRHHADVGRQLARMYFQSSRTETETDHLTPEEERLGQVAAL